MNAPVPAPELADAAALELYLADPARPGLLRWTNGLLKRDPAALAEALPRLISPGLDYTTAQGLKRVLDQLRGGGGIAGPKPLRTAVLAGFTAAPLADLIELYLHAGGIAARTYLPDYGTFELELLDPGSGLHGFAPELALLLPTWRDITPPVLGADASVVDAAIATEVARWQAHWSRLAAQGAQVVQDLIDPPAARALGNLDGVLVSGWTRYCRQLNEALIAAAPPHVAFHDLPALASEHGRRAWAEPRYYFDGKLPCSPEAHPVYAHSLAAVILGLRGKARKCLALDLDNTLWGGVIGDDGIDHIRIGQGDAESEAFLAFQHYALALKARGVILAVCSKNSDAIAREAFERHPGMALRPDDIACFAANWDDKAANLSAIAKQLNIGIDSIVFVDDNPAERSIIRQLLPEVAVPEMPADPADYVAALDRMRYFDVLALSREDLARASLYKAEAARQLAQTSSSDLAGFLRSLELVAAVEPIAPRNLDRAAQLIIRSNQFNLTTRRHGAAELERMAGDPAWETLAVSLKDRFGDNGLIAVILAQEVGDALRIDTWLMSCRVLKRGVEAAVLEWLIGAARARGLEAIEGDYLPTPKNGIVKDLFAELGFTRTHAEASGATRWRLALDGATPPVHHIKIEKRQGHG